MSTLLAEGSHPWEGTRAVAPDGSVLVTRAEPPRLSVRVPAGWSIEEPSAGIAVACPDGGARIEITLVGGDDPVAWAAARAEALGFAALPEARPGLLAGRESLAWSLADVPEGGGTRLFAAPTGEGLLTAVLTWTAGTPRAELNACLESLSLR